MGFYQDDKMHGVGTVTFSNESVYSGDFVNGISHGSGLFTFADDSRSNLFGRSTAGMETVGEFANGRPNGNVIL